MNREQAGEEARKRWGQFARVWILAGVRYVSKDCTLDRDGWNHFDGQGKTWDEALADAEKERVGR